MKRHTVIRLCMGLPVMLMLASFSVPAPASQTLNLSIGTSTLGGTMQIMATPLAKIMTDKVPGLYASVQNTPGPQANLQLINADEMKIAYCSSPVEYEALTGTGWAKGRKYDKSRTILVVYPSYFEFVVPAGKGLNTVRDLAGKRVHTSIPGTTPDIVIQAMVDVLGLSFKEKHPINTGPAADMLRDGRVDAVSCAMGIPTPFIMDLQATSDVRLLGLSDADQEAIAAKYPYLAKAKIPADTYKNQPEPVNTFALWNYVVVHKDMSDDLVYQITKAVLENLPEFTAAAAAGKDFKAENIKYAVGLVHPGAARYYKEIGIDIPADRVGK